MWSMYIMHRNILYIFTKYTPMYNYVHIIYKIINKTSTISHNLKWSTSIRVKLNKDLKGSNCIS